MERIRSPGLGAVPGILFAQDVSGPYGALALARSDGATDTLPEIVAEVRKMPGVIGALAAPLAASLPDMRGGEAA